MMKLAVWLGLLLMFALGNASLAQPIQVTTFGRGSTPMAAVDAAKAQAIIDAAESISGKQASADAPSVNRSSGRVSRAKVISTTKIAADIYEAEIEAEVILSGGSASLREVSVALIIDQRQGDAGRTLANSLQKMLSEQLSKAGQVKLLDSNDPDIAKTIERWSAPTFKPGPVRGSSFPRPSLDLVVVLNSQGVVKKAGADGQEHLEARARVSVIDAVTHQTRHVATVKSSVSKESPEALARVTSDISLQLVRLVPELIGRTARGGNRGSVITVPMAGVRLGIGQSVVIYKQLRSSDPGSFKEVNVGFGEIVSVGAANVDVASEAKLAPEGRYFVKPISKSSFHSVVSDADW